MLSNRLCTRAETLLKLPLPASPHHMCLLDGSGGTSHTPHIVWPFLARMNEHNVSVCLSTPTEARKYQNYDLSILIFSSKTETRTET